MGSVSSFEMPLRSSGGKPLLLEREGDLDVLTRALTGARSGSGRLVLIQGPAGIGKTRLLREAMEVGRGHGFLVRSATAAEMEREVPFGIARQLFEAVIARASEEDRTRRLAGSARLALPVLDRVELVEGDMADPFAPLHGLYWLLANVCESQPTLLAVDDLQWADPETARYLDYVSRRLMDLAVVMIVTLRTGEPGSSPEIARLRAAAEIIRPRALTSAAVRDLVAAEAGYEPTEEFASACVSVTSGNPFLVRELVRALSADGVRLDADAAAMLSTLAPDTVADHVRIRLGRFGDDAIALASAVAVLGGTAQLRHVALLARVSEERAATLCDQLRDAEILGRGTPLEFVHPLVRQAIYRELPDDERSAMHRRAAETLAATGSTARDLAPHLMACTPNGDQWVVARLREAAREARLAGAPETAAALLERILQEPAEDDLEDRFSLGLALSSVDPARAPRVLADVADRAADPDLKIKALSHSAFDYFAIGNFGKAIRRIEEALTVLPPQDDESRLLLHSYLSCYKLAQGRSLEVSQTMRELARNLAGATPAESLARLTVVTDLFFDCAPVEEVVRVADKFPPQPWESPSVSIPIIFAAKALTWSGHWDRAHHIFAAFTEWCHVSGNLDGAAWGHGFLADTTREAGQLRDAEVEATVALDITKALGSFSPAAWQASTNLLAVLIERADLERAQKLADELPMEVGPGDVPVTPWPLEMRAYLRMAQGDLEGGVEDLLQVGERVEKLRYFNPSYPRWRQEVTEALAALGRASEAEEIIAVAEERAQMFGAAHVMGSVLRARATIEPRRRAIETLQEAVAAFEAYGPPHELARTLVDFGAALSRDGRRREAREPLRRALELAMTCGAGAIERRARDELVTAGARARLTPHTGVGALTATELTTARLAGEGFRNRDIAERLFVTIRTVETHLTHVYEKLGIESRRELKRALGQHGQRGGAKEL